MADFEWKEFHIEWCLEKFKDDVREISARDISARYKPRNGEPKNREPRKGKSKNGEPTLDIQDFKNLMRLMVLNKYARVTNGSFKSRNYKIRMVSDKYPYIQEIFNKELFEHAWMIEPMPDIEVVRNTYLPFVEKWNDLHQEAYDIAKQDGYTYFDAFYIYNYRGGDFDLIFPQFPQFDIRSKDGSDARDIFILYVQFFVSVYKAFDVGLPDLKEWFRDTMPNLPCPQDHNTFFAVMFNHHIVGLILTKVGIKDWKVPHATLSNNMIDLVELVEYKDRKNDLLKKILSSVERGFNPGEGGRYYLYLGYATKERNVLHSSERLEVIKAVGEVEKAFVEILLFYKARFGRFRRSEKRSTNVN